MERIPRKLWAKTRSDDWWNQIVLQQFTEDWKDNFRMTHASFLELVSLMAPAMSPRQDYVRTPVPVSKRVAIALYKMASCCEYRVVANQFGVHKSTVKKCVYMFCRKLVKHYMNKFITLWNEEAEAISRRFEISCHLPQILGAIDGTHIPMLAPQKGYWDFINRKMWMSCNMQGNSWWARPASYISVLCRACILK